MLCALQVLIAKIDDISTTNNTGEGYIVCIDYSKAFDDVSHCKLFKILPEMGFPPPFDLVVLSNPGTGNGRTVPRWSSLSAATRYRFAGSSKGTVTSIKIVAPPSVTVMPGMLRPSSRLLWTAYSQVCLGTASIPRSQIMSVSIV
ncbi:hypothetical protein RRG08_001182 [Elysia crispata]|uniref:Reverse transcriptase domain-containing protein n=1 Tax=Elysia crispata TaxID=231223 RepID=A0AAE1AEZ2_9GAST|nr:hypothetical protein RRG08_001182 [Elysia crispata]